MVPSHENQSNLFAPRVFHGPESRGTPDMSILCWRSWRSSWMMDLWPESTPFYCCVHGAGAHPCFVFVFFRMLNHWIKEVAMKNQCGLQWLQLGDICKRVKYMYIYIWVYLDLFPNCALLLIYRIPIWCDALKQKELSSENPRQPESIPENTPLWRALMEGISIRWPSRAEEHPCVSWFCVTLGACWNGGAIGVTCPHLIRCWRTIFSLTMSHTQNCETTMTHEYINLICYIYTYII